MCEVQRNVAEKYHEGVHMGVKVGVNMEVCGARLCRAGSEHRHNDRTSDDIVNL